MVRYGFVGRFAVIVVMNLRVLRISGIVSRLKKLGLQWNMEDKIKKFFGGTIWSRLKDF